MENEIVLKLSRNEALKVLHCLDSVFNGDVVDYDLDLVSVYWVLNSYLFD